MKGCVVLLRRICGDMFFFFKQKTAYEMRISDWSSDVCSSDLRAMDDCARAGLDRQVARNCAVEDETDAPMQRRIASDHAIEGDILLDGEGAFDLVVHRAHYAAASMSVRAKSLPLNNS